jgi:hypothetical protein
VSSDQNGRRPVLGTLLGPAQPGKLDSNFVFEVFLEPAAHFGSVLVAMNRDGVLRRSGDHLVLLS